MFICCCSSVRRIRRGPRPQPGRPPSAAGGAHPDAAESKDDKTGPTHSRGACDGRARGNSQQAALGHSGGLEVLASLSGHAHPNLELWTKSSQAKRPKSRTEEVARARNTPPPAPRRDRKFGTVARDTHWPLRGGTWRDSRGSSAPPTTTTPTRHSFEFDTRFRARDCATHD